MKKISTLLLVLFSVYLLKANDNDTLKIYRYKGLEVSSEKDRGLLMPFGRANYTNVANNFGFSLIRKGTLFAQDVYSDGFKRGDIEVVIDGERYHAACPNRMDSPLSRVNPSELESVAFSKSATEINSGIGGRMSFSREKPIYNGFTRVSTTGISAGNQAGDISVDGNYHNNKISVRYVDGAPYLDGKGRSFKDLYPYKETPNYELFEAAYYGISKEMEWRASYVQNSNIHFPYLMMDEIENYTASAFTSYKGNKLYFNYTDHLMTNEFRTSMMGMETDAQSLTIGLNGEYYDAYFRNWNADNNISGSMNGMPMNINNEMIANFNEFAASGKYDHSFGFIDLSGRISFLYNSIDDVNNEFFERAFDDVSNSRFFANFAINAGKDIFVAKDVILGIYAEAASDRPMPEQMYFKVDKPGQNADRIGNPTLDQPIKSGLRSSLEYKFIKLEGFANYVHNFVDLNFMTNESGKFETFYNTNALLAGVNVMLASKYLDFEANFNWGENTETLEPLAEIRPFATRTRLKYSPIDDLRIYATHIFEHAQSRVARSINEFTTPSWNRIDLGAAYRFKSFQVLFDIENVLNHNYYRHLSFARNAFSSGMPVYEPGTLFRLSLQYAYDFD
jgi:hypothetical protein